VSLGYDRCPDAGPTRDGAAPRLAAYARTAVRAIDHTGIAPIALSLLRDECARDGVPIPDS
jgi:hypothetical protein